MNKHNVWNSITLEIPEKMISETKKGKVSIRNALTKTKNLSKSNGKASINIVSDPNIEKPVIINDGTYETIEDYKKKKTIKKRQNISIKSDMQSFKANEPIVHKVEYNINSKKEFVLKDKEVVVEAKNELFDTIDKINYFLESGRKENFKTKEQQELFSNIYNAIVSYDYYPTPDKYAEMIYNDAIKEYPNEKITILDIACGLLSLSKRFIENKYPVYLIDENPNWGKLLEPINNSITHFKQADLLDLPTDYYYNKKIDIIVMNPPFSIAIDYKKYNLAYLLFLIKAIDILQNQKTTHEKILYIICPKIYFKNRMNEYELDIPETTIDKATELFKMDYRFGEGGSINIEFMGDVSGFKTIRKGKPTKLNMTFGLFKISTF